MGVGKIIAIVGAVIGILSVLLSIFIPDLVGWYKLSMSTVSPPMDVDIFLTGFGSMESDTPGISSEIATFVMFGGILIILGAIACVVGAFKEMRKPALGGAILMIIGPLLLLADLLMTTSDFAEAVDLLVDVSNGNIFAGSFSDPSGSAKWGIHTGFFLPIVAGVIGLVGGALVERKVM